QTALIIELADAMGIEVVSPRDADTRAGTVTVRPDHAYEISRELLARNFVIDYRANAGIRIAPHFYNSDEEVRHTLATITAILEDESWKKHSEGQAFVT